VQREQEKRELGREKDRENKRERERERERERTADVLRYGNFEGAVNKRHVTEHRFWPVETDEHSEHCCFSACINSSRFLGSDICVGY